jgi:carboxy-terminal domain RNA polymerase II polypeptide A small phosphatase
MHNASHLLILDLDETLIFATQQELDRPADFRVAYHHIYRRPFLDDFLRGVFKMFKVAVWTSAAPDYARDVCAAIFPSDSPPLFVWDRTRCTLRRDRDTDSLTETKPLSKLTRHGYSLDSIVAIDDSPEKYQQNYGNLVRVAGFEGAADDDELVHLLTYLAEISKLANVRRVEKRGWRHRY